MTSQTIYTFKQLKTNGGMMTIMVLWLRHYQNNTLNKIEISISRKNNNMIHWVDDGVDSTPVQNSAGHPIQCPVSPSTYERKILTSSMFHFVKASRIGGFGRTSFVDSKYSELEFSSFFEVDDFPLSNVTRELPSRLPIWFESKIEFQKIVLDNT